MKSLSSYGVLMLTAIAIWLAGEAKVLPAQGATTQLLGEWEVDAKATQAALNKAGNKEYAQLYSQIRMTLKFLQKGKLETGVGLGDTFQERKGSWRVIKELDEKDSTRKMEIEMSFESNNEPQRFTVEFLKADRAQLFIVKDQMPLIILQRLKKK